MHPITTYIDYWTLHANKLSQCPKAELPAFLSELAARGVLDISKSQNELETKIYSKGYSALNICPSLYIQHHFTTAEVIQLDQKGQFAEMVRQQMDRARLAILG